MISLDKAKKNKVYSIVAYQAEDKVLYRLLELGFTVGQKIKILKTSLLGRACLIEIRGYLLSVKIEILKRILVE